MGGGQYEELLILEKKGPRIVELDSVWMVVYRVMAVGQRYCLRWKTLKTSIVSDQSCEGLGKDKMTSRVSRRYNYSGATSGRSFLMSSRTQQSKPHIITLSGADAHSRCETPWGKMSTVLVASISPVPDEPFCSER